MAEHQRDHHQEIVVGLDGSEASKDARTWAAREAALTGSIEAVMVSEYPTYYGLARALPDDLDVAEQTRKELRELVLDVVCSTPKVAATERVIRAHPATVLLDKAKDAEFRVVGSRAFGAIKGMPLESVSGYLASHAPCPLVVMHDHAHKRADEHR